MALTNIYRRLLAPSGLALVLAFLLTGEKAEAGQCGTPRLFEPGRPPVRVGFKSGNLGSGSKSELRARTLESDHFLLHYSLRGIHKVRTGPEDAVLVRLADSLYALLAALPEARRDSAVYARLDGINAPHPAFILKAKEDFEGAWDYYIGKLGMRTPLSGVTSVHYTITASLPRKFPVDFVDVGTADAYFYGETYAVTYPPSTLAITFENDFLWHTTLDSLGVIHGLSIKSQVAGAVLHDYNLQWELGIKVTAYHEFYHAIQFTYIPGVQAYHAWYEISAVGMEERNAPEVNDYFQYLPCVLKNHDRVALTTMSQGPCTHAPMYGHGIFHMFLSHALDSSFDVKVWEELSRNKDMLPSALEFAFSKYSQTMLQLYREYASHLFFSGGAYPSANEPFTPDLPLWTSLSTDSVDMSESTPYRIINLPAVTFAVLKVTWDENSELKVLLTKGLKGIVRIHANADSTLVEDIDESQLALGPPRPGFKDYYVLIPNSSFTGMATVEIREPEPAFFAFPNPVKSTTPAELYFSQPKDMAFPAQVEIYTENGVLIRTLGFPSQDATLTWDLRDGENRLLKPGVYYYRLEKETLRPLVILR